MFRALTQILTLALLALPSLAQARQTASSLDPRISAIVDRPPFQRAHWGMAALDAATGDLLYARNADRLFVPASVLKLVVTATAAHVLDRGFRYTTSFAASGPVEQGVLVGDLVIHATGDPTISARYKPTMTTVFEAFADSLAVKGIRSVSGGIVVDESEWDAQYVHGDWESYDLLWWYAAPVAPLGFNDNSIDFRVAPGSVGQPARITWQPESSFFVLRNNTITTAAGNPKTLDFDRVPGTDTILATGRIPADAAVRTESFAVSEPARYAATVFREVLERKGIAVARKTVEIRQRRGEGGRALFRHHSPPLDSIIAPIMLRSQNWFAEQLLKTIGRQTAGVGSWEAGLAAERNFLKNVVGLEDSEFSLRDASGLSSGNLITPAALARLLRYIYATPRQSIVRAALPVSGAQSGSLRTRLTDLGGRVQAKTGSVRNAASLAGFATAASGRAVVFVVIANGTGLPAARVNEAIDDVVRAIVATH
jgi:D-alanyl-D-alanine carboxypeptidase/D-alanyl-D-alanine-endopeptidase (penicillin-binding protein 4)